MTNLTTPIDARNVDMARECVVFDLRPGPGKAESS